MKNKIKNNKEDKMNCKKVPIIKCPNCDVLGQN